MELIDDPSNPVPSQAQVSFVTTPDGLTLRVARWRPTARRTLGTILIVQGRSEFIEKYFELIVELRRKGYAVVAFDFRGQGHSTRMLSDPKKGHVDSFEEYILDIRTVLDQVMPKMPKPHFGLAHSMGSAALILTLESGETRLDRAVLLSPLAGLASVTWNLGAEALAYALDFVALGARYVPGGGPVSPSTKPFEGNRLSQNPVRYGRISDLIKAHPDLSVGDPTIRWVLSVYQMFRRFADRDFGRAIKVPTLMVVSGADPLCDSHAAERLATKLRGCMSITIPGARHELLMEQDRFRNQALAAIHAFLPGEATTADSGAAGRE